MAAGPGAGVLNKETQTAELGSIYVQYHEELCRAVIKKFTVSHAEAEDVVQTAFIRFTESSAPVVNPRAFLYKTCSNIAIDQIRRRKVQLGYARSVAEIEPESAEEIGPERRLEAVQRLATTFNDAVDRMNAYDFYDVETVGDRIVRGDGPWYVSEAQNWREAQSSVQIEAIQTFVVVEADGEYLVDDAYWTGHSVLVADE